MFGLEKLLEDDTFANLMITLITGALTVLSVIINSRRQHHKTVKNLDENFKRLEMREVRTELNQAIDHDYGVEVVTKIYTDYKKLGGNNYMTKKFEQYLRNHADKVVNEKEEEEEDWSKF